MKYLKIFSLVVLSVCMIVLAGCGEEEKYNTAKNEVLTLMDEAYKVEMKNLDPLPYNELDQAYNEALELSPPWRWFFNSLFNSQNIIINI